ncbi:MAG: HAMP domain-containing protein [Chloroflexia bacterium]|nr:HAMP domain-containing protein [Chloroflexia bacterium]
MDGLTRHWSLRTTFFVVAAAGLLPLMLVVLYIFTQSRANNRNQLIETEYAVADVVARALDFTLTDNAEVLKALAVSDTIQSLKPEQANPTLLQYRFARPSLTGLFLIDAQGNLLANAGPDPSTIGSGLTTALNPAMTLGEPGVSRRLIVDGAEVIAITVPVWAQDPTLSEETTDASSDAGSEAPGQPLGAVGALLSVDRLLRAVLPFARGDTEIAVFAEGQLIVAQAAAKAGETPLVDRFAEPIAAAALGVTGEFTYEDTSGAERLAVYTPVDFPGAAWTVLVTNPSPATYGPNRDLLLRGLIGLIAASLITLVVATLFGEVIARPLRRLTEHVSALRAGDFSQRVEPAGAGEVRGLGLAVGAMTDELAGRVHDFQGGREEHDRQAEQMRDLLRRTVRLQEDERRRIASEIHDAVSPLITGALYQTRALRLTNGSNPAAARDEALGEVGALLEQATNELHGVIFDLRPPDLDDLGVVAAIERYVQTIQRTGLACRLDVVGDPPVLTPEVRLGIYRIVQEALHNVLRHAGADEAIVRLEANEHLLRVMIRDNGAGFDAERAVRPTSLGLLSMRERAAAIGATFDIATRPGGGTAIVIERSDRGDVTAELPVVALSDANGGSDSRSSSGSGFASGAHLNTAPDQPSPTGSNAPPDAGPATGPLTRASNVSGSAPEPGQDGQ